VIRLPAADPARRIGALVLNPGGPGASGVTFLREVAGAFPAEIRDRFDLVSFDPRGVGLSDPVRCASGPELDRYLALDPDPERPAEVATVVAATRRFVEGCVRRSGLALLAHVGTVDAARDLERLRIALGEQRLTYLGFSYGTFLGATFANLYPTRVRAFVLDGAIDPALPPEQADRDQAVGFEHELDALLASCQASPGCPLDAGGSATATFGRVLARLESGPPLPAGGGQVLDDGTGFLGLVAGLYSEATWPELEAALADVLAGNGKPLVELADEYAMRRPDGTYANTIEANTAIDCVDRRYPRSVAAYEVQAVLDAKRAPVFGGPVAWGSLPCAFWPVPPTDAPAVLRAQGSPAILVVGTTGDPATPYSWAVALARELAHGVLLTHEGEGHTAYFDSSCVRRVVDAYLVSLAVPPAGTVCR
jgi:pimeloyl-ACP methyl ester carboxylesterase